MGNQQLDNDSFCRSVVTFAQCNIGTEKYPDAGVNLDCENVKNSHSYCHIVFFFKNWTKDCIFEPDITLSMLVVEILKILDI